LEIAVLALSITFVAIGTYSDWNDRHTPFDPSTVIPTPMSDKELKADLARKMDKRRETFWICASIIVVPALVVRLTRVGVTYIIEGKLA
jgi:hypothetical protein